MKYLKVCSLFIVRSEVLSLLALVIMGGMFLWDIYKAAEGYKGGRNE